jgi:hypothetical protein
LGAGLVLAGELGGVAQIKQQAAATDHRDEHEHDKNEAEE